MESESVPPIFHRFLLHGQWFHLEDPSKRNWGRFHGVSRLLIDLLGLDMFGTWENHRKMGISWGLSLVGGDWNHGMDYDFP